MLKREDIERFEKEYLARYAMKSRDSAGREYSEPTHATRTCYQRDRDRIVHCEAFRKLEYKTQVFAIFEGDYYRTRLTHTIEVAQIARTIGRNLRLNEDLIEAIALAHDLGHIPFGHAGEEELKRIMKQEGLRGFNHNKRSFDIVTKFEKRYPSFDGLNLTREVRVGILKHETMYDSSVIAKEYTEDGPTLEAKVVDIADSLAYLNHDIDDGLTSGCITKDDLNDSALWRKALEQIQDTSDREMLKYQIVKALIDMQVRDLLSASDKRLQDMQFASAEMAQKYHIRNKAKAIIGFSSDMAAERDQLQGVLNKKLYHHYRVERMTSKAKRIIHDLFTVYKKNPEQLPPEIYDPNKGYNKRQKLSIICNYIAGMTDRSALEEYNRFFNPYTRV